MLTRYLTPFAEDLAIFSPFSHRRFNWRHALVAMPDILLNNIIDSNDQQP